jgi:hypothetical protein
MPLPGQTPTPDASFDVLSHVVDALKQTKNDLMFEVSLDGSSRDCEVMLVYGGVDYVLRAEPR